MNHLCIIDAHSFIYKFYFTVGKRPFINSKNQDVTLLHMFTQKVLSILSKYRPTHIVIAFDEKGPTFRNEIYPKYKANRDKAPEEINRQTPILKELLSALGFAILSCQGYEADDMIALATKVALEDGFEVSIFTQDKDLLQLVQTGVKVISMKKGEDADIVYDERMVEKVWQIKPSQIVDFLTLMGDSSDNIPGVRGIGEKTALELIKKYSNIDQLLNYIHTIPSTSTAQKLKDGIEDIKLSKSLVDLSQSKALIDLKDKIDIESWKVPESFGEKGLEMLLHYELKQLYETISGLKYEGPYEYNRIDPSDYHLIDSKDKIEQLFKYLSGFEYITIDTETTGLDLEELDILGASFCAKE
ncbi:MAG TPA: 5'-3' exonuclease H3TH domain-containing protein, partial [Exilispira sp.]|nr:5'-3' exonuclease H3TH domain-containing protein [Exilispira sp.]